MSDLDIIYDDWRKHHRALGQGTHAAINTRRYPGTRELCCDCGQPTGRAGRGDDSLYAENGDGPLCKECLSEREEMAA